MEKLVIRIGHDGNLQGLPEPVPVTNTEVVTNQYPQEVNNQAHEAGTGDYLFMGGILAGIITVLGIAARINKNYGKDIANRDKSPKPTLHIVDRPE